MVKTYMAAVIIMAMINTASFIIKYYWHGRYYTFLEEKLKLPISSMSRRRRRWGYHMIIQMPIFTDDHSKFDLGDHREEVETMAKKVRQALRVCFVTFGLFLLLILIGSLFISGRGYKLS